MASDLTDRYELGETLGVGGTATVFRATHHGSGRQVAVKIFDARRPGCQTGRRSEADTLAELHHPGLVEIDEVGVHDGCTYLVMRLVEGEALSQRIDRGPLAPAEVVAIGARLADALGHVHDRGVVHRDVKPSNVLLDTGQVPHLTDFGVSKLLDATRITATGSVVGTPAYMAPEQVRGREVGPAADVYALGLVLIEALTGMREFPGSVVESAVARLHRGPVVPPGLPVVLRTLLAAMTAQEPADRPSASAVARRLESLNAAARMPARSGRVAPATTHRRLVATAVAASALVIATAVVMSGLDPAERAPTAVSGPAPAEPTAVTPVAGAAPAGQPVLDDVGSPRVVIGSPGAAVGSPEAATESPATAEVPAGGAAESADGSDGRSSRSKGGDKVKKDKKGNGEKE